MLADSSKQIYLTDDELKKSKIAVSATYINGDDPNAVRQFIESMKNNG